MRCIRGLVVALLLLASSQSAYGEFDIVVDFSGDDNFRSAFEDAEDVWESILTSRVAGPLASAGNAFTINAVVESIDGIGGTLGSAVIDSSLNETAGGFVYSTEGTARFDSADFSGGPRDFQDFESAVLHEVGHLLGFGTLWTDNNLLPERAFPGSALVGLPARVGRFTGANAVARYNQEFGLNETFVPVENDGGFGTANSHFDEEFFGVALNGETTVPSGLRLGPNSGELLTGFLDDGTIFISETTAASFQDLGFTVDFDAVAAFNASTIAVPEPSSSIALLLSISACGLRRRR